MATQKEIIAAFVVEKIHDVDAETANQIVRALNASVTLEQGNSNEDDETRSISLKEDTDGKITAKSMKLFNLMKISYYDLFGFLSKEVAIGFTEDSRVKIIVSLFNLFYDFYPKFAYTFNETDAKVLLAIWQLNKKSFSAEEVLEEYAKNHTPSVASAQIARSLTFFKDMRVVKDLGKGQYEVKEKITYERS
jgi:hypothetical protein